ncbi:MAG: hypothetical protein LBC18_11310, partial [Opitutaceae bacterium]|nr:hypothetical protein [Opitutaceae bacterium]
KTQIPKGDAAAGPRCFSSNFVHRAPRWILSCGISLGLMLRGGHFWQGGPAENAVVCLVVLAAVSAKPPCQNLPTA